jgi:hypothetical protein
MYAKLVMRPDSYRVCLSAGFAKAVITAGFYAAFTNDRKTVNL